MPKPMLFVSLLSQIKNTFYNFPVMSSMTPEEDQTSYLFRKDVWKGWGD